MSLPAPDPTSTVVVTGASAGIGAEIARQLADHGHGLTLVARRRERLDELAAELVGVRVDVVPADLSDPADRRRLVDELHGADRVVAGLVNNAGFGSYGRFDRLDPANEARMVQVNVAAVHELTAAFVAPMVERGEGAIANISSVAGFQPIPGQASYGATKAFVTSFSEALHAELSGTGVSCTNVCPGPVITEFADVAGVEDMAARLPRPGWTTAEQVARATVDAMRAGRRSVIPGLSNRVTAFGGRHVPRSLLLPALRLAGGGRMDRPQAKVARD